MPPVGVLALEISAVEEDQAVEQSRRVMSRISMSWMNPRRLGTPKAMQSDEEGERGGEQQVLADRCAEEEAEGQLGGRHGRDAVEVEDARGPGTVDRTRSTCPTP